MLKESVLYGKTGKSIKRYIQTNATGVKQNKQQKVCIFKRRKKVKKG
jgi:hypothetical protein